MATIHMGHTTTAKEIVVSIGSLGFNLATKDVIVPLSTPGFPRENVSVNMLETYQALTTTQQTTIKNWYRQQVALGMNAKLETDYLFSDIPDIIFEPEPEEPPA